jgi:hypothetical protein
MAPSFSGAVGEDFRPRLLDRDRLQDDRNFRFSVNDRHNPLNEGDTGWLGAGLVGAFLRLGP